MFNDLIADIRKAFGMNEMSCEEYHSPFMKELIENAKDAILFEKTVERYILYLCLHNNFSIKDCYFIKHPWYPYSWYELNKLFIGHFIKMPCKAVEKTNVEKAYYEAVEKTNKALGRYFICLKKDAKSSYRKMLNEDSDE